MVGAKGFEPSTSWSRTRRASQAALRPERPAPDRVGPSRSYSLTQPTAAAEWRIVSEREPQNRTPGSESFPAAVCWWNCLSGLELVAQCELHHTGVGQQTCVIAKGTGVGQR